MAPIIQTEDYLYRLNSLVAPENDLEKHGFIIRPLTDKELLLKRRCHGCNKSMSQLARTERRIPRVLPQLGTADETLATIAQSLSLQETETMLRCKYHLGSVIERRWTCCNQYVPAEPCSGAYEHIPSIQSHEELQYKYQFYPTPFRPAKQSDIHIAVALDCEMGTAASGDSELIRVTMIDYFSEEVLIDNIVEPDVHMSHLNTRYSGVSWADVKNARRQKTILRGKEGARRAIWKYVGLDTIVIGHGVSNDLRALRWIHATVVDSMVTESGRVKRKEANEANKEIAAQANSNGSDGTVDNLAQCESLGTRSQGMDISPSQPEENIQKKARVRTPGRFALKTLAKQHLDRDIQTAGRRGHDSLEDAIATRDLAHWHVLHPEK